jgi:Mce-associated membrane protein
MTEMLEEPMYRLVEENMSGESSRRSSDGGEKRSKATVKKSKSRAPVSKPSGTALAVTGSPMRAIAGEAVPRIVKIPQSQVVLSSPEGSRSKANGSLFASQELIDELSANGSDETTQPPVVVSLAIHKADDDPAEDSLQESQIRRGPWGAVLGWVRVNLLSSSLAVALVVAVALLALTQVSSNSERSAAVSGTSAIAAAKIYAVDLATYNYKHLNQNFGKVLGESTPMFKQSFNQTSKNLKTLLVRYHASATAKVVAAGIVSATSSRAVALVDLNQTVVNNVQKGKPTTGSRVEITLLRSGGRWLIDEVTFL